MEPRRRVLSICHKEQREAQHASQHGDYLAGGLIDCLVPWTLPLEVERARRGLSTPVSAAYQKVVSS